ncbi:MAG: PIN domain-containing protein [Candidatus Omnitrophota bacterium]|nr:MAG: PIN domain-containing protein [Candidatus Omnitrophota bacterium]
MSRIFIDTNLFVYSIDQKEPEKKEIARAVLEKIINGHDAVISTQVIKEFYVIATMKLRAEPFFVKNIIYNFRNIEIVNNDIELIEQAIDIGILSRISFWDSLIIASAEKANCKYLVSEDINAGQTYHGVMVVNPFVGYVRNI